LAGHFKCIIVYDMKIIHTSDLHLNSKNPERVKALEAIISLGKSEDVDLVLVAGDLFDSNQEADRSRPALRDLLSSLPFKVLAIPGNHLEPMRQRRSK